MENLENLAKDPREESSQVRSPTSIQFSFKSVLDSCRDTCYNFSIEGREGEGAPPPRHISARLSLTASILLSVHSLAYSLAGKCNNSKPTGGGGGGRDTPADTDSRRPGRTWCSRYSRASIRPLFIAGSAPLLM